MDEPGPGPTGGPHAATALWLRAEPGLQRGLALLLAAEAETRLRFIEGFVGATIWIADENLVAVFLEWLDGDHARRAERDETFCELMTVLPSFAQAARLNESLVGVVSHLQRYHHVPAPGQAEAPLRYRMVPTDAFPASTG